MTIWVRRFGVPLLILFASFTGTASAFDGKRSGFCLGFGFGAETITSFEEYESDHQSRTGFQTTLDIGVGIDDQFLLLYSGHTTVNTAVDPPYDRVIWVEPTIVVRYYFKPTFPSWYVFGGPAAGIGTGFARWEEVFGSGGFGITAGGGFQLGKQWHLQVGSVFVRQDRISFRSFHVTMNVVGF